MNKLIAASCAAVAIWSLFFWEGAGHNPAPVGVASVALILCGMALIAEWRRSRRNHWERELRIDG
ncbi:MAG TPA: hypothetical protein VGW34_11630 [Allosphingosinicella sp.]|nr:hypothetical protein [Allosphingosinicella sp.]